MRLWRNRQTRTFEGRMGNHPGSSPGNRTTHSKNRTFAKGPFFISGMGGAVTGTVQQMEYRLVPILHPLHAIGQRYFSFHNFWCHQSLYPYPTPREHILQLNMDMCVRSVVKCSLSA